MSKKLNNWIVVSVFIVLVCLDYLSTIFGLTLYPQFLTEANPLVVDYIEFFGLLGGLTLLLMLTIGNSLILYWCSLAKLPTKRKSLVLINKAINYVVIIWLMVASIIRFVVVINNLYNIISIPI